MVNRSTVVVTSLDEGVKFLRKLAGIKKHQIFNEVKVSEKSFRSHRKRPNFVHP